jgi:hypothetical protein
MPTRNVQIDFVGMCLVIEDQDTGALTVGLIDEPRHLHVMTLVEPLPADGSEPPGIVTTARPLQRSIVELTRCVPGTPTIIDYHQRLPELADFGPVDDLASVLDRMAVQIRLPASGVLEALPPILNRGQWRFRPDPDPGRLLTDRSRFRTRTNEETIGLAGDIPLVGDSFHITVLTIDQDASLREDEFVEGSALVEFDLLFRSIGNKSGPVPTFVAPLIQAHPGIPLCPQARVRPINVPPVALPVPE